MGDILVNHRLLEYFKRLWSKEKKILSLDNSKFSELEIHFPFQENIHFNVSNVNYCKIEKKKKNPLFGKARHKPVLELTKLLKE